MCTCTILCHEHVLQWDSRSVVILANACTSRSLIGRFKLIHTSKGHSGTRSTASTTSRSMVVLWALCRPRSAQACITMALESLLISKGTTRQSRKGNGTCNIPPVLLRSMVYGRCRRTCTEQHKSCVHPQSRRNKWNTNKTTCTLFSTIFSVMVSDRTYHTEPHRTTPNHTIPFHTIPFHTIYHTIHTKQ